MAVHGYITYPFTNFASGLNLRDKADAVQDSECIDCLNVTFGERGAIRPRDGYVDLTAALTNIVDSLGLYYASSGTRHILAGCGTRLEAINTAGSVVASQTGLTGGPYAFASFAAPGSEFAYAANGADTTQRWNGAAWSSGATSATVNGTASSAMPKAGALAVLANTNRLVSTAYGTQTTGGPGGTTSTPSRAHFSNLGAPETWETDGTAGRGRNFVDFTPGDGEQVMGSVTWRELTFIFKESKFFVVYGESANTDGTPIFNYRAVSTGIGLAAKNVVCTGRDGVYFMARNGVYVTTGAEPKLLSDIIHPIWSGDPEVYFQSSPLNMAQLALARIAWHDERLYVAIPTGTATANDRVLVHDAQHDWWSMYDLPASALVSFRRGDQFELHFGYSSGAKKIGHLSVGTTVDPSAAITWRWRSGWGDYNSPLSKTIRQTEVWGAGAVAVQFSTDFRKTLSAPQTAIYGVTTTWPSSGTWGQWIAANNGVWPGGGQISDYLVRFAVRGTTFSTQFSNSPLSSFGSVHRAVRHLREFRGPSLR